MISYQVCLQIIDRCLAYCYAQMCARLKKRTGSSAWQPAEDIGIQAASILQADTSATSQLAYCAEVSTIQGPTCEESHIPTNSEFDSMQGLFVNRPHKPEGTSRCAPDLPRQQAVMFHKKAKRMQASSLVVASVSPTSLINKLHEHLAGLSRLLLPKRNQANDTILSDTVLLCSPEKGLQEENEISNVTSENAPIEDENTENIEAGNIFERGPGQGGLSECSPEWNRLGISNGGHASDSLDEPCTGGIQTSAGAVTYFK